MAQRARDGARNPRKLADGIEFGKATLFQRQFDRGLKKIGRHGIEEAARKTGRNLRQVEYLQTAVIRAGSHKTPHLECKRSFDNESASEWCHAHDQYLAGDPSGIANHRRP
ncbi:MAG: hypothetical protein ACXU84_06715 [Xanthobacteraceae bacterium]